MVERRGGRMTWAQVREAIDAGRTGDKVKVLDPAIASLGTDAEAGGAHTSAEDLARSVEQQTANRAGTRDHAIGGDHGRRSRGPTLLLAGGGAILALVVVLLLLTL